MSDHIQKLVQQEANKTQKPQQEQNAPETVNPIVDLQRLVGNQGVQRLIADGQIDAPTQSSTFIQTKMTVGAADDPYEREADQVADQVVNGPGADVAQREEMPEEEELMQGKRDIQREDMEEELAMKRMDIQRVEDEELMQGKRDIQREEMPEEELAMKRMDIQRSGGMEGSFDVGGDIEEQISSKKGSGGALGNQSFFEDRFGQDFSNVNVHTDSASNDLNNSIQARAFTTGSDIFFREGEYSPDSKDGQELIAHELTHVVQQGGSQVQSKKDDGES